MPTVRSAIEAFVSGSLDYGGLQAEFREAAEAGIQGPAFDRGLEQLAPYALGERRVGVHATRAQITPAPTSTGMDLRRPRVSSAMANR